MTPRKKLNIVLLLILGLYNLYCNGTVLISEDDDESRVIPMGGISLMLSDTSAGNPELAQVLVNVQKVEVFQLENEEHEEHNEDHEKNGLDESILLIWQYDITGLTTMPTFRITYVPNGQTNEVELYHGPGALNSFPSNNNILSYVAPISSHQSTIDSWAGRTVLYNIQAMMDGGVSSDKSTVAVTYLSQYDLFKEDKSSMCYFWPDANTKTFYAY